MKNKLQSIDVEDINIATRMLTSYIDNPDIKPLLTALEALKSEPQNAALQTQVTTAFRELKTMQGAVLTYAPILISLSRTTRSEMISLLTSYRAVY